LRRAAVAGEHFVDVRRIVLGPADRVIVLELLAGLYRADRLDEHAAVLGHRFAVRIAAVVDEARVVAVDAGVDDDAAVDDEQEGVVVVGGLCLVAAVSFLVRHALAQVFDDARALADAARRKGPEAMHARTPHAEHLRSGGAHTAIGALMAGWYW
jgi:hypothetical protein